MCAILITIDKRTDIISRYTVKLELNTAESHSQIIQNTIIIKHLIQILQWYDQNVFLWMAR